MFKQQSPEFDVVVADFQLMIGEAVKLSRGTTLTVGGALPDGPVMDYVRNKLELELNYCTTILAYLIFKSGREGQSGLASRDREVSAVQAAH